MQKRVFFSILLDAFVVKKRIWNEKAISMGKMFSHFDSF